MPSQTQHKLRIKNPFWILTIGLISIGLMISIMSVKIYHSDVQAKRQLTQQINSEKLRFELTYLNEKNISALRLASYSQEPLLATYNRNQEAIKNVMLQAWRYARSNDLEKAYDALASARTTLNQLNLQVSQHLQKKQFLQAQHLLSEKKFEHALADYTQATHQFVNANNFYHYWLEMSVNLYIFQARQTDVMQLAIAAKKPEILGTYAAHHNRLTTLFKEMSVNGESVISHQESVELEKTYAALYAQDKKIISLIKNKKFSQATTIMNTSAYLALQHSLEANIKKIHIQISEQIVKAFKEHDADIVLTIAQVLIVLLCFSIIWFFVVRAIRYWQQELTRANAELVTINEALDLKVVQRTQHLQQAFEALQKQTQEKEHLASALQKNQKLQAVGTLAAGIAHDFNNLLAVILAHGEYLKKQLTEDTQQHALEKIVLATSKAGALTQKLLTFARKETQHKTMLQINEVIKQTLEIIEPSISKKVHIHTDLAQPLPPLNADRNQISQLLINLALNANDAMPNGGELTLTTAICDIKDGDPYTPRLPPGRYLNLQVTDTGCGIAAHDLEHVFDPFYTTKEVGKGTGLGLSSVYGIVQQHDGHIDVESAIGKGTCFLLFFPTST